MSDDGVLPRTWQQIAKEVVAEKDPHKLNLLVQELNRALDERDRVVRQEPQIITPPAKRASA